MTYRSPASSEYVRSETHENIDIIELHPSWWRRVEMTPEEIKEEHDRWKAWAEHSAEEGI